MTAHDYMAPESIGRLQQRASVAGIVGLVACGICFFLYGDQYGDRFFHSYLIAFMFVLGLSLGSLGLLMLQHLTGAGVWRRRAHRQDQLVLVDAAADRPVDLFKADQEIDDLSGQVGLRQLVDPADDETVVKKRALQRLQQRLEKSVLERGVLDAGDDVLVDRQG